MAAGPVDPDQRDRRDEGLVGRLRGNWHNELCAEHDGTIRSFAGLSATLSEIEDYEALFTRNSRNLLRVAKITGGVAAGVAVLTPAAIFAAPHLAASLGSIGVLGAAGTGTAISTLSGAALGSASLAAIGGGTMAGGLMVVTAAGASLGGALGGRVSNAYLSEVKEFRIRKQNEGVDPAVVCVDGFLTEKMDDPREWKRALRNTHASNSWYHVNWESKTRRHLGRALCLDSSGEAARRYGVKLAGRAAKKAGRGINPATWLATVADMVDNPWHLAMAKAAMTGVLLADILARTRGQHFTLIGHSLGARVIYYTLLALGTKQDEPVINEVFLLGGAVGTGEDRDWQTVSRAVSGKIHNCYSSNDQVLKCLYRAATAMISQPIGAYPIPCSNPKITNWDFSDLIAGHTAWKGALHDVMARISESRTTGDSPPTA